jgi:hypothetical protein
MFTYVHENVFILYIKYHAYIRNMSLIEEFLDYFLTANDETRRNVNVLIKEAVAATIKLNDERLVIGLLEFLNNDKVTEQ